ncbi:proton channel OTOP2-like [Syngnathoides biaculeatus]|uniref:proton channel OTOP2-like n=1 Tax=Syngnathoides biaculeatus TaxID=300417 RepID=UPI002ADE1DD3|nr:proton channel OTOP2-like [Syngnathoides biaculeatus]
MRTVAQRMLRTCNKLFARKIPNGSAEAHPSNIETAARMENIQHLHDAEATRGSVRHAEAASQRGRRDAGWLLSTILCINVLILGSALVSSSAFNRVAITAVDRQVFLMVLLALTALWMLFYAGVTYPKNKDLMTQDSHAGPVWLRGGLVLFGLLSLLMDVFKAANSIGYLHCDSAVKVAFPVVQAVFLFAQTYFLWVHAKDCVQVQANVTRCGLMLTFSTNLLVWLAAVTEESIHQTGAPHLNLSVPSKMYRDSYDQAVECSCSHSSCDAFKEAFFYLYPFNIEYSLFASVAAYVMWKNVGRLADGRGRPAARFRPGEALAGPVLGFLLVAAGLMTFIVYEVDIALEDETARRHALLIHFVTNIVIVSVMCISTAAGCAVYRLDRREDVSEKNPSRNLDVPLLLGASMGQLIISYFSIVAAVAGTGARDPLDALNLSWAVLVVLQLSLQNYFIIEGLRRQPFRAAREDPSGGVADERKSSRLLAAATRPGWKRRAVKEVCAFLMLANIILWIMPAFGARPQFDHTAEIKFYKFGMWTAVVNIGLPFGIFYRMHSVASLFEVYVIA